MQQAQMHPKVLNLKHLSLVVGILLNLFAFVSLSRSSRQSSLIVTLKCLMANNFIALTGVTSLIIAQECISKDLFLYYSHWFCAGWVVFRFFGIMSGCISVVMSIERYLAFCHVFFHHTHLPRTFTRNTSIGLSFLGAVVTFLPFVGFGIYYNDETKKCILYREAKTPSGRAYALLFFVFGTLICIVIVICNTFVIKALIYDMPKRMRTACSNSLNVSPTEIRVSKCMIRLNVSFVVCWMPQMISILIALWGQLPQEHWFYKLSKVLLALHFALDPCTYVLSGKNVKLFFSRMMHCWTSPRTSSSNINQVEGFTNIN